MLVAMILMKKTTYLIALLAIIQLTSCGGGDDDQLQNSPKSNFRLVSIDYDKGANDSIENKYVYEYDHIGNKTKVENTNYTDDSLSITTINTFDGNGNLLTTADKYTNKDQPPILHLRTYSYSKSNKKVSEKYEDFKHGFYYLEKNGVLTTYNTASGEITSVNTFSTDNHGNKLRELIDTNNDGKTDKEINTSYNSNGKILTTITTDPRDIKRPRLFQEDRTYDSKGNVLTITSSQFSEDSVQHVTKYQYIYDSENNISTSTITYDSGEMDKKIYLWEKVIPVAYFGSDINWAGTGCKAGSISVVGANTASLSILFDSYEAGKGSTTGLNRVACSFSVPIKIPTGYKISLFTADWEGYVEGKGELSRKYFLAGQPYTPWKKNNYNKPDSDNFLVRDNINHDSLSSTCDGGAFNLRIDSQIKTIDENSYMTIDSSDLHNKIKLLLRFKSCK